MDHTKSLKKGCRYEKNTTQMSWNESIPHWVLWGNAQCTTLRLLTAGDSSPSRTDICPQAPASSRWISLGWQCGKLNEPIQIDICQVSTEISEWQGLGLKVESTCNAFKFQPRASGEVLALTITYQDVPLNGFATNTWVQLGTTMLSYLFVGSSLALFSVCTGD